MKKSMIKALALGLCFSVCAPIASAAQAAPALEAKVAPASDRGDLFLPVRDIASQWKLQLAWKDEAQQKLVLTDGQASYQVVLDAAKGLAQAGTVHFPYRVDAGRICLPRDFYAYVMANARVDWTGKSLVATPLKATEPMHLRNLATYVTEPKPAAPAESLTYFESGQATWYGGALHGNYTASGERFNMYANTAAHKTLPFGTVVKVTNLQNGRSTTVRITDRGPFAPGRVIDLSRAAAEQVDMISSGVVPVKLEIVG